MKKIIGIIAAVAIAASVFAIDFSGAVKVTGSLFDMTFADGAKPTAFTAKLSGGGWYSGSRFQTAFYGDRAGAQFAVAPGGDWGSPSVWVQPLDMLKITFLNTESKLNQVFDYSGDQPGVFTTGTCSWNFELKPMDAVTVNLVLGGESGPWWGTPWIKDGVIGNTGLVFKYGADFGTIGAIVKFSQTAVEGADTANNLGFGVGYSGKFDPVSLFVDVGLNMSPLDTMELAADFQVSANVDALSINAYLWYLNKLKGGADEFKADNTLGFKFKLQYAMDTVKPYIWISDQDVIVDGLGMVVKPGIEFNIGAALCDVAAQFDIAVAGGEANIGLSVPFEVTVAF